MASLRATRLRHVRDRLLRFHKTLLDAERAEYERRFGRVGSSGEWLQLVLGHEHFAWLRPMSGLIVRIDDWIARADGTSREAAVLLAEVDGLTDAKQGEEGSRLVELLDSSPDARLAFAETRDAIEQARNATDA